MTVTTYGFTPSVQQTVFVPDQLIAGDKKIVTGQVQLGPNQGVLARGAVLGMVTAAGATQGQYLLSVPGATDGSQNPSAIVVEYVDTTSASNAPVPGPAYLEGEFNAAALVWGTGQSLTPLVRQSLRGFGVHVKTPVSGDIV